MHASDKSSSTDLQEEKVLTLFTGWLGLKN
jgi:hypothetical protein